MDEIIYIARIDARPWAKSAAKLGGIIPFAMFFAAIEVARRFLNSEDKIPEFQKYFVIAIAALVIVFVQDVLATYWTDLQKIWKTGYTTKMIQGIIFTALISAGLFVFALVFLLPDKWIVYLDPHGDTPDWLIRVEVSSIACLAGTIYVAIRTYFHRVAEFDRMHTRPAAHLFEHFRTRETRCLIGIYFAYYLSANALISYLLIRNV